MATEIVKQVRHGDVHNVAKNHDHTDEEVWAMVEHININLMVRSCALALKRNYEPTNSIPQFKLDNLVEHISKKN